MHNVRFEDFKTEESIMLLIPTTVISLRDLQTMLKETTITFMVDEKEKRTFYPTRIDTAINILPDKVEEKGKKE